jgi:hypothetical protein
MVGRFLKFKVFVLDTEITNRCIDNWTTSVIISVFYLSYLLHHCWYIMNINNFEDNLPTNHCLFMTLLPLALSTKQRYHFMRATRSCGGYIFNFRQKGWGNNQIKSDTLATLFYYCCEKLILL